MANTGFNPVEIPVEKDKKSSFNEKPISLPGKITGTIGSGEDAKNSLIYLTLKWAFTTGIIISICIVLNYWFFRINDKVPDFVGDIKIAWEIIVPIITLALGYAFGKSHK